MPFNKHQLKSFPYVGNKKTAVVLNSLGCYKPTGTGPGADSHVLKCFDYFVKNSSLHKSKMHAMMRNIPAFPGILAK
jgi:hypothetical protein